MFSSICHIPLLDSELPERRLGVGMSFVVVGGPVDYSYMISDKLLYLSESQLSHLKNEHTNIYFSGIY